MLNPFRAMLDHYNPFRSPVVSCRCDEGRTFELRSPLRSRRFWYGRHECQHERRDSERLPQTQVVVAGHTVALFASDAAISLTHKSPKAYYRNEISLRRWLYDGACRPSADAREPEHPRWSGAVARCDIGPLTLTIDTALRQERGIEEYRAKKAREEAV